MPDDILVVRVRSFVQNLSISFSSHELLEYSELKKKQKKNSRNRQGHAYQDTRYQIPRAMSKSASQNAAKSAESVPFWTIILYTRNIPQAFVFHRMYVYINMI